MFNSLDIKKTTELFMVRKGWFSHEFELTDKIYSYGKITWHRFSRRKATVITAAGTWTFQRGNLFSRSTLISDENDVQIGKVTQKLFSRKAILTLDTGFKAEFYRPSFWSREEIWNSVGYGDIMSIRSNPFSLTTTIHIGQSMAPVALIPLLVFLGSYLISLRRQRQSRH